ncbi:hypothetical protein [Stenotrophomonas geniculata]|uniref:hypothetical protein n=1 Tax=Stenotrophomonas geniculata TaxID=86188 RepID=UPI00375325C5
MTKNKKTLALIAVVTAPASFLASSGIISLIETALPAILPQGGWEQIEARVSAGEMVYALTLAPLIENLVLLFTIYLLSKWIVNSPKTVSALAAAMAAIIHVLTSGELAYIAVFPGFFVMSSFIQHSERRSTGYWISVIHHVAINAISVGSMLLERT